MYSVTTNGNNIQSSGVEIVADTVADINELPVTFAPGSTCFVLEDGSVYMLGHDAAWHAI